MTTRNSSATRNKTGGFILVAVLVIVMLGSMVAMSLLFRLQAEEHASAAGADSEQAWLAAMSGVEEAFRLAAAKPGAKEWQDNPHAFKDRFVCDTGSERWYFTLYSKGDEDSLEPLRYGLTDEASKLNLNTATEAVLLRLPGIDQNLIDA
ncbi:MAG: hypothetical protein JWM99_1433, partial [Verrucomicrobiales bacterium]|nr:hypothetical protein [Verrucomicrobiales bacterium]